MDLMNFLQILVIISIIKGVVGFFAYWFLAHHIPKIWAGAGIFFLYSLVPWLLIMYSDVEMIEQLGRLAIWGAETFISILVGGACVLLYEFFTGKSEAGRY